MSQTKQTMLSSFPISYPSISESYKEETINLEIRYKGEQKWHPQFSITRVRPFELRITHEGVSTNEAVLNTALNLLDTCDGIHTASPEWREKRAKLFSDLNYQSLINVISNK